MLVHVNIKIEGLTISRVVRYFVLADLLFLTAWGLIHPLLAVFVVENIPQGTVFIAGSALALYWLTRAILQLPIGIILDQTEGEKDDFYVLIISLMLAGFASLLFLGVNSVAGLFAVMVLEGIAFSLYTPAWGSIFVRHLDQNHMAFDLSLGSAASGLAIGVASFVGGALAKFIGFHAVFIGASILAFVCAGILLWVPDLILPRGSTRNLFKKSPVTEPPQAPPQS